MIIKEDKTYWTNKEINIKTTNGHNICFHYIGPIKFDKRKEGQKFPFYIIFAIHNVSYTLAYRDIFGTIEKEKACLFKNDYPLEKKEYKQIVDKFVTEI